MSRRWAPGITAAQLATVTLAQREFAYDTTNDRFVVGDGATAGGLALAFKSETDLLTTRAGALEDLTANLADPISEPWATVLATSGMDFSGLSGAMRLGEDPDQSSNFADLDGALLFNVTKTSTATAAGNYYGQQTVLLVSPASNQSSSGEGCDHRAGYFATVVPSAITATIQETVGGSFYNIHQGSGALAIAYGGTNQFFNEGAATVAQSIGGLCASWQNGTSGGKITNAYGSYGVCASYRASVEGITTARGAYGEASNRNTGSVSAGYAVNALVWQNAAGLISDGRGLNVLIDNESTGTITSAYGARIGLVNDGSGTVTNYYGLFIASSVGTAPTTENYGLYVQADIPNYVAGAMRLGDTTAHDAKLYAFQNSHAECARFTRQDAGASGPVVKLHHDSASPAASDFIGYVQFAGDDSAGNEQIYSYIAGVIESPTTTAENGQTQFWTTRSGASAVRATIGAGVYLGAPTGGDKGTGTLNATAVYDDNVLLTCYVRDVLPGQEMPRDALLAKWDARVPNRVVPAVIEYEMEEYEDVETQSVPVEGEPEEYVSPDGKKRFRRTWRQERREVTVTRQRKKRDAAGNYVTREIEPERVQVREHEPLRHFLKKLGTPHDPRFLESYHQHWVDKRHLTAFPNEQKFDIEKGMPVGAWQQRTLETLELMHGHDWELRQENQALRARLDALEAKLASIGS